MKPENRETTTIELAAVFYVRKRKNPFFEFLCNVARSHAIAENAAKTRTVAQT